MPLSVEMREKIALFCSVERNAVVENIDSRSIYEVPVMLEREGLGTIIEDKLDMPHKTPDLTDWHAISAKLASPKKECKIAVVGKYIALRDAYKSVVEALNHGGLANDARIDIVGRRHVQVTHRMTKERGSRMPTGFWPGRFGHRESSRKSIRYARVNKVPFFGICLGLQCTVIEVTERPRLESNSRVDPDFPIRH